MYSLSFSSIEASVPFSCLHPVWVWSMDFVNSYCLTPASARALSSWGRSFIVPDLTMMSACWAELKPFGPESCSTVIQERSVCSEVSSKAKALLKPFVLAMAGSMTNWHK